MFTVSSLRVILSPQLFIRLADAHAQGDVLKRVADYTHSHVDDYAYSHVGDYVHVRGCEEVTDCELQPVLTVLRAPYDAL